MQPTVFFGPFIGEFGWECVFWIGWIRKVCRSHFKSYRKIACAFPGRQPFYPAVDEFWQIPQSFVSLRTSGHGYFTDGWRDGYPGKQVNARYEIDPASGASTFKYEEQPLAGLNIESAAEAMLAEIATRLPPDTRYFVPWKWNHCAEDDLEFGLRIQSGVKLVRGTFSATYIPFAKQSIEPLVASPRAAQIFDTMVPQGKKVLTIFPRFREIRRPDKNWDRENYVALIAKLQERWPDVIIALCGEPGGAYFVDDPPPGCINLISAPVEERLDLQLAALNRSVMALGSISGALLVAANAGCPTILWCPERFHNALDEFNLLKVPLVTHPNLDPSVETVVALAEEMRCRLASRDAQGSSPKSFGQQILT